MAQHGAGPRVIVLRLVLATSMGLAVAACAQVGRPAGSAPAAPTAAAVATATPVPTPSGPAPTLLNPAPEAMLGKWTTQFAEDDVARIVISPTSIRIIRFATATVRLEVFGDELVLSHSQLCEGEGRYAWKIEGDTLRFDSVTPDACDGRAKTFDGVEWTRTPG